MERKNVWIPEEVLSANENTKFVVTTNDKKSAEVIVPSGNNRKGRTEP